MCVVWYEESQPNGPSTATGRGHDFYFCLKQAIFLKMPTCKIRETMHLSISVLKLSVIVLSSKRMLIHPCLQLIDFELHHCVFLDQFDVLGIVRLIFNQPGFFLGPVEFCHKSESSPSSINSTRVAEQFRCALESEATTTRTQQWTDFSVTSWPLFIFSPYCSF